VQIDRHIEPFLQRLSEHQLIEPLKCVTKDISNIRNGFDHAWTEKQYNGAKDDCINGNRLSQKSRIDYYKHN